MVDDAYGFGCILIIVNVTLQNWIKKFLSVVVFN